MDKNFFLTVVFHPLLSSHGAGNRTAGHYPGNHPACNDYLLTKSAWFINSAGTPTGMKTAFTILVVIIAVLACGCMAAAPAQTTAPAVPNLVGTWTGPMEGYDEDGGFTDYPFLKATMTVTEQHGRLFSGHILFTLNGTETTTGFAGAIGRDGRTLSIAEKDGGYCSGMIMAADEIELTYMQDGSQYSIAIDSFKRVQN